MLLVTTTVLVAFFVLQSFGLFRPTPGERIPDLGRRHLAQGETFSAYNSTPPTSGPHGPPVTWGAYDSPLPDENVVHNLEHGGIVISHNKISTEDLQRLRDFRARYPRNRFGTVKIVIRPYDKIPPGQIALTAWGWLLRLDAYDEQRIREFVDAHLERCCEPGAP